MLISATTIQWNHNDFDGESGWMNKVGSNDDDFLFVFCEVGFFLDLTTVLESLNCGFVNEVTTRPKQQEHQSC